MNMNMMLEMIKTGAALGELQEKVEEYAKENKVDETLYGVYKMQNEIAKIACTLFLLAEPAGGINQVEAQFRFTCGGAGSMGEAILEGKSWEDYRKEMGHSCEGCEESSDEEGLMDLPAPAKSYIN